MLLFVEPKPPRKMPLIAESPETPTKEPVFRKDGELRFLRGKTRNVIFEANIEVALTPAVQEQGLMYRRSMPDSAGMLFVFNVSQPLTFWMKNTIIPLDIIYADSAKRIVRIANNTIPFSEKQIPSIKPALYAVEMNAGFARKHGLQEGDYIDFDYE
jgi:uncharacterized membrane protein (UPF0127 family)